MLMPYTRILEPFDELEQSKLEDKKVYQELYSRIINKVDEMKMGEELTFEEFLKILDMTENQYVQAIRSSLKTAKIFLKRERSEVRVNSYNNSMLKAWQANMDIQYVLDAYACAAYIVSYISKGQRGMSNLLHEACEEVRRGNNDIRE